jgi:clan AA aspartic protease
MGRVVVDVELANHRDIVLSQEGHLDPSEVRRATVRGVVDTGAAMMDIPKSVAKQLGVPAAGKARVRCADHRRATRDIVDDVYVSLMNRETSFQAIVKPGHEDVLVGAIVLEALDLVVDCRTQKLHPPDPDRIVSDIE